MKVNDLTRSALKWRRGVRKLTSEGFQQVKYRNYLEWQEVITDVKVGPDGRTLFWKKEMVSVTPRPSPEPSRQTS